MIELQPVLENMWKIDFLYTNIRIFFDLQFFSAFPLKIICLKNQLIDEPALMA